MCHIHSGLLIQPPYMGKDSNANQYLHLHSPNNKMTPKITLFLSLRGPRDVKCQKLKLSNNVVQDSKILSGTPILSYNG